jgi:hypothetical protein
LPRRSLYPLLMARPHGSTTPRPVSLRHVDDAALTASLRQVGGSLRVALRDLLAESRDMGPSACARRFGVHVVLMSRVLRAISLDDELHVLYAMPSVDGLQRVVAGAKSAMVDPLAIEKATLAINRLGDALRDYPGGRQAMLSALANWSDHARHDREATSKYQMHQAVAHMIGMEVEVNALIDMRVPDPTNTFDLIALFGRLHRLRRLRNTHPMSVHYCRASPSDMSAVGQFRLDRTRLADNGLDMFLPDYCSMPVDRIRVMTREPGRVEFVLPADEPMLQQEVSLAWGTLWQTPPSDPSGNELGKDVMHFRTPSRRAVWDSLIHKSIDDGHKPLLVGRVNGPSPMDYSPDDPRFEINRLDMELEAVCVGEGVECLTLAGVPDYVEMLKDGLRELGFPPEEFVAYRCAVNYPPPFVTIERTWPFARGLRGKR